MTSSPYASEAKIDEALTAIGAELIGQTEQQLLQQLVVAAATAAGGSGGASTWGSITGTLSSQTDLQNALNAKLNLSGGSMTGPVSIPLAVNIGIANARAAGLLFGSDPTSADIGLTGFNNTLQFYTSSTFIAQLNSVELGLPSTTYIGFSSTTAPSSTKDLFILRGGPNIVQLGQNNASVATNQTLRAHNVTTGQGADLILQGGLGSTASGYVRLGTTGAGLSFFGAGGRTQPAGDVNDNVTSAGGGSPNIHADTQFDGGLGGHTYTIGGVIRVLKELGILG
jgi:hypothetical protein